jgi:hypothetical protein
MRKIVYIFAIIFFVISCDAQKTIVETKSKDILVFGFNHDNVNLINIPESFYIPDKKIYHTIDAKYNKEVYNKKGLLVLTQNWTGYGSHYIDKKYSFIQNQDTMSIACKCGQEQNYFFRNLEFQKGKFELSFTFPKKQNVQTNKYESQINYILGNQIKTPQEVQSVLFKNSYIWWETKGEFKNIFFKDLKFVEIDLKDSINVKLKKIE